MASALLYGIFKTCNRKKKSVKLTKLITFPTFIYFFPQSLFNFNFFFNIQIFEKYKKFIRLISCEIIKITKIAETSIKFAPFNASNIFY